jgi:hypothetical protein
VRTIAKMYITFPTTGAIKCDVSDTDKQFEESVQEFQKICKLFLDLFWFLQCGLCLITVICFSRHNRRSMQRDTSGHHDCQSRRCSNVIWLQYLGAAEAFLSPEASESGADVTGRAKM